MAEKVYTTPLLDKLGVRHGASVVLLGLDDPGFERELRTRTEDITTAGRPGVDLVFYLARQAADLDRLAALRAWIKPAGAVWVLRRKGKEAAFKDTTLIQAGGEAGMVDNKIASFSDELSAMRFVIRLRDR